MVVRYRYKSRRSSDRKPAHGQMGRAFEFPSHLLCGPVVVSIDLQYVAPLARGHLVHIVDERSHQYAAHDIQRVLLVNYFGEGLRGRQRAESRDHAATIREPLLRQWRAANCRHPSENSSGDRFRVFIVRCDHGGEELARLSGIEHSVLDPLRRPTSRLEAGTPELIGAVQERPVHRPGWIRVRGQLLRGWRGTEQKDRMTRPPDDAEDAIPHPVVRRPVRRRLWMGNRYPEYGAAFQQFVLVDHHQALAEPDEIRQKRRLSDSRGASDQVQGNGRRSRLHLAHSAPSAAAEATAFARSRPTRVGGGCLLRRRSWAGDRVRGFRRGARRWR